MANLNFDVTASRHATRNLYNIASQLHHLVSRLKVPQRAKQRVRRLQHKLRLAQKLSFIITTFYEN